MPYAFPTNIPRPAKNWTPDEQKKCIAAANAVLASGKDEQTAIFACIRAAGRTENPGGKTMGIFERLGEMFKSFGKTLTAEEMPIVATAQPNSFAVFKQADGAYRWFGWVSNHFRDNDNPREILSAKAHRDFVAFADKTGKYPELWLWHVPGSRIGKADMVDFADGFLVESGLFDPGLEGVAEAMAKETDPLTMSHGFVRTKPMDVNGITDGYIQFEASVTPQGPEANPWTGFTTMKEADMPLSKDKRDFLAKYLPESTISALEGTTDELRKAAEAAGVDWKAVEAAEAAPPEATITPPAAPTMEDIVSTLAGPIADAVAERLQLANLSAIIADVKTKTDALAAITTRIEAVEKALAVVQKSDDEKIAATMTPKVAAVFSWFDKAASKSKDNTLKEGDAQDEALKDTKPFLVAIAEAGAQQALRSATGN